MYYSVSQCQCCRKDNFYELMVNYRFYLFSGVQFTDVVLEQLIGMESCLETDFFHRRSRLCLEPDLSRLASVL